MAVSPIAFTDPAWPMSWSVPVAFAIVFATASVIGLVSLMTSRWLDTPKQQDKALQRYRDEPMKKAEQERKKRTSRVLDRETEAGRRR